MSTKPRCEFCGQAYAVQSLADSCPCLLDDGLDYLDDENDSGGPSWI